MSTLRYVQMSGDVRANWLSNYLANPVLFEGKIKIGDETKFTYREEMYEIKLSIEGNRSRS